jgi:hypothetical protein
VRVTRHRATKVKPGTQTLKLSAVVAERRTVTGSRRDRGPAPALTITLIVRLADGLPAPEGDRWRPWNHGKSAASSAPGKLTPPLKRYPDPEKPYFADHIERNLTPAKSTAGSGRWAWCPTDSVLVAKDGSAVDRWRIDLAERLHVPIADTHVSYALLHLTLEAAHGGDVLRSASRLRQGMAPRDGAAQWQVEPSDAREAAPGPGPPAAVVAQLLGPAHAEMRRRCYWVLAAMHPISEGGGGAEQTEEAAFRWSLVKGLTTIERGREAISEDPETMRRQTQRFGRMAATVHPQASAITTPNVVGTNLHHTIRSFWCEALLMGLIQNDELDRIASRLAALGEDPLSGALDILHEQWLSFRNRLWWSQLSALYDPPNALLASLRRERGTQILFDELCGDFDSYTQWRRQRSADAQADGLAHLQLYGASLAVVGALGAVAAIVTPSIASWPEQLLLVALILAAGVATYHGVRRALGAAA